MEQGARPPFSALRMEERRPKAGHLEKKTSVLTPTDGIKSPEVQGETLVWGHQILLRQEEESQS